MPSEIHIPVTRLDLKGALQLADHMARISVADWYVFDFANLTWVEPFGMLYAARQLRLFRDGRKPGRCRAIDHGQHGYAAYMGFFQSFGLAPASPPAASATDRYIPITEVRIRDLHIQAGQSGLDVRQVIESRCADMAAVLARGQSRAVLQTLSFSLREILRNVVEHANADHLWYCAQYWPERGSVELALLDEGRGIRAALSRNPHLQINSDDEALRFALLPGVSGVAFAGSKPGRTDEWANSGYGLFMTSELCSLGGSFMICSGAAALLRDERGDIVVPANLAGTALRLKLDVSSMTDLGAQLTTLSKKGEDIASAFAPTTASTASKSSRMLSDDFGRTT